MCCISGSRISASTCSKYPWDNLANSPEAAAHLDKSDGAQRERAQVERVGDEVENVPQVVAVLAQPVVPQLFDLDPDKACNKDASSYALR
jgi:hypothetical protein